MFLNKLFLGIGLLLLPTWAYGACNPPTVGNPPGSPVGSLGCQPPLGTPQSTDLISAWRPSLFPASAGTITYANLISSLNFGSPGPIGNVSPSTGAFTDLTANNITIANTLNLGSWTTSGRPGGAVAGTTGFNTTTGALDVYSGSAWVGAATFLGGNVPNATDFQAAGTALTVDNNALISGALTVSGGGILTGTFAGSPTFSGTTITITNSASIGGSLGVTGTATLATVSATNGSLSGTLNVTGATTLADLSATTIAASSTLNVTGAATFGSTVLLSADPTLTNQAATKHYVDTSTAAGGPFLQLIGGSLAGPGNLAVGGTLGVTGAATFSSTVLLAADPTLSNQAATKHYVDGSSPVGGPFLSLTGGNLSGPGNLSVGGTLGVTGATTLSTMSASGLITATGGIAATNLNLGTSSGSTTTVNIGSTAHTTNLFGATVIANQPSSPALTISGNAGVLTNSSCGGMICQSGLISGTITSGIGHFNNFAVSDALIATNLNAQGWGFTLSVAPSAGSATGTRVGMAVNVIQVGTSQGGTITAPGTTSALASTMWMQSNLSGSAASYIGAGNGARADCELDNYATFTQGCSGQEIDYGQATPVSATGSISGTTLTLTAVDSNNVQVGDVIQGTGITYQTYITAYVGGSGGTGTYTVNNSQSIGSRSIFIGPSFGRQTGLLLMHKGLTGTVLPNLGPNWGIQLSNLPGNSVGLSRAFLLTQNTMDINGIIFNAQPSVTASGGLDLSNASFRGYSVKLPFQKVIPLQAIGVTGATRLTSDGQAASSYANDVIIVNAGSSYTSQTTQTVTGCTGVNIGMQIGTGNTLGVLGVQNGGTNCAAEATVAVTGGGGSSGTAKLVIEGNTLNFPINSTIDAACTITATTLKHAGTDAIGWHMTFGATMGATASTTAIIAPSAWTLDYQTVGAAAKFSGNAPLVPTADTTFGAVNLTITPTTGTWDVGGSCTVTKSSQT